MLGKSLGEMAATMTAREFSQWSAYLTVEPPEEWADWRTGVICSTLYATHGKRKRPQDFMPSRRPAKTQTTQQQIAILKTIDGDSGHSNHPA